MSVVAGRFDSADLKYRYIYNYNNNYNASFYTYTMCVL